MPSKSPAQARLMRAVAHGWKPSRIKGPSRAVAREFVDADRKYSGGFAENRYWTGGLAAMNEINSGVPETLRFQEGGVAETEPVRLDIGNFKDFIARGYYVNQGWTWDPNTSTVYPPQATVTGESEDPRVAMAALTPELRGSPEPWMPRVIPGAAATPFSLTSEQREQLAEEAAAARETPHRERLREHKARVAAALNPEPEGAARGGHMNYQEGGTVPKPPTGGGAPIPGHMEGQNPYPPGTARYRMWERKYHIDPPPPPPPPPPPEEEQGWLSRLLGVGEEYKGRTERELEKIEGEGEQQARGGHVKGYQIGGLARAHQGAIRNLMQRRAALRQPRAGIPRWSPQQQAAWRGRQRQRQLDAPSTPQAGGMAARIRQLLAQRAAQRGAAARPPQPRGFVSSVRNALMQQKALQQRGAVPGRAYPGGTPGFYGPGGPGRGPSLPAQLGGGRFGEAMRQATGQQTYQDVVNRGGGGINPEAGTPGGLVGGPRVPPNMRGYLQRQRMMNRPPANVGGGVNRVGQQDQQGGLSRALQRGTGRPPMSRRTGFPGRGRRR